MTIQPTIQIQIQTQIQIQIQTQIHRYKRLIFEVTTSIQVKPPGPDTDTHTDDNISTNTDANTGTNTDKNTDTNTQIEMIFEVTTSIQVKLPASWPRAPLSPIVSATLDLDKDLWI